MFAANNTLVSIVIPVYNCEKYIENCIDSVVGQAYEDIEIILVDDGSTDQTGTICNKYAETDMRIKVIHQRNKGLISARNEGIRTSSGEYVAFVDGDDWIEINHIKDLLISIKQEDADFLVTGICRDEGKDTFFQKNNMPVGLYVQDSLLGFWEKALYAGGFFDFGIQPYRVSKLFKRSLLNKCIQMEDSLIREAEDAVLIFTYIFLCKRILVTEQCSYHYVIRKNSMTQNRKFDYFENTCRVYLQMKRNFEQLQVYDIMKPQLEAYMRMLIWLESPSSFIASQKYIFPFKKISAGAKIIVYGAGYVGRVFVHQLRQSDYCSIAAWVDKNPRQKTIEGENVISLDSISHIEYDYVVIAIDNHLVVDKVYLDLQEKGICPAKIIKGVDGNDRTG